jgi:hypothetical protein
MSDAQPAIPCFRDDLKPSESPALHAAPKAMWMAAS